MNHTSGPKELRGSVAVALISKTPVFGLLQRGGRVYTEIVPNCARKTLQAIIRGKVEPENVIHSDSWRGYNGLVDLGYKKHYRVHHGKNEFTSGKKHINSIESFILRDKKDATRLIKMSSPPVKCSLSESKKLFYFAKKSVKICIYKSGFSIFKAWPISLIILNSQLGRSLGISSMSARGTITSFSPHNTKWGWLIL